MTITNVIFIIAAVLIIALVALAATAEKHVTIKLTKLIAADQATVYDQLRLLERYPDWSPFKVQDPGQHTSVTGTDGEIGATFHWEGDAEKSKGSMTLMEMGNNEHLKFQCNVEVPFKAQSHFVYDLTTQANGTLVTQTFTTELAFPVNVIGKIIGLRKQMEATNQQGLDLLKPATEVQLVGAY
ncbi:MAG: hypothetical protein AB8G22_25030 [Saprospiraceae bacterium]